MFHATILIAGFLGEFCPGMVAAGKGMVGGDTRLALPDAL
jgi:hypothetical protein